MSKKQEQKKIYDFGEKKEEYHAKFNEKLPVFQSPKYHQSKAKAIELIESNKYDLKEGDFWILMNATKTKKMMYTGLIISHDGCLKINDKLDEKLKFKPSCVSLVKDEGEKSKVMNYICDEQGIYEFGEISPKNCMNDYPYAMVLKRLMDRVILKNSRVGFHGIYSDSESEDFKQDDLKKANNSQTNIVNELDEDMIQVVHEWLKNALNNCQSNQDLDKLIDDNKFKQSLSKLTKLNTKMANDIKELGKSIRSNLTSAKTAQVQEKPNNPPAPLKTKKEQEDFYNFIKNQLEEATEKERQAILKDKKEQIKMLPDSMQAEIATQEQEGVNN